MTAHQISSAQPTFLQSDRKLARAVRPFIRFSQIEAAGGIVLVVATLVALVWANSPWKHSYEVLWSTKIRFEVGSYAFAEDLGHVVNDLLMAVFFFVVGMEIKRELVTGELRDRRAVALPAMAALGGMIVPALIYLAFNAGGDGVHGWGIPMATDIAFALGVVALLGTRVPPAVKILLLTLAIVDDIGAIAVIAVFYTDHVDFRFVAAAVVISAGVWIMHRARIVYPPMYVVAGLALWIAVYESGIHATIAGVVMGLLTPARPAQTELEAEELVNVLETGDDIKADDVRATAILIRGSVSACDRLIDSLHPWTSYLIVPIFALANAGIILTSDAVSSPSAVLAGVAVALVVGKFVGVATFSWISVRSGLGRLPDGVRWGHVIGVAAVAGIGFTVSLFIAGLAFDHPGLQTDAKIGTLLASIIAAAVGATILSIVGRTARPEAAVEHAADRDPADVDPFPV
ncbi:MAG: Na+/H+ antiporter NhaA [Ilumatobacteraceae bacterium]